MATEILMPALSPTMEEGTLAKWLVKEGDTVSAGDIMAEIETDKATMEFEAVDEGIIGKILIAEGTEGVKVNSPIAILVEEGEDGARSRCSPHQWPKRPQPRPRPPLQPRGPAPAAPQSNASPDWPADAEMVTTTVREALRDAMAEEMRRDDTVFVMGEEVAEYQGAYKITQGLLDEFGAAA
jgi:pyruvate dehydrogenase E1 component beta subunit